MIKPRWWIPIVIVSLVAAGWRASAHARRQAPRAHAPIVTAARAESAVVSALRVEDDRRTQDIVFYERRVAEDTASAIDQGLLAGLYMQRARASGDFAD